MAYSTIQQKIGICKDCSDGNIKPLIAGRCQYHYKLYRRMVLIGKRKFSSLKNEPNNLISKEQNEGYKNWYLEQRKELKGTCLNCGKKSHKDNEKLWVHSIAHILPKSLFKSISKNNFNWIELCITCHTAYDRTWDEASKMPIFKLAKEKYNLFKEQIAEEEKRRIPNQFLI